MVEKAARLIVRRRIGIMLLFLLMIPICLMMMKWVHINFDFTRYLSEATMTKR